MNVKWCTIHVNNLEKSKAFYQDILGMGLEREFSPNEGVQIVFFSAGDGMQIELIYNKNQDVPKITSNTVSMGIGIENYDEVLKKAQNEGIAVSGPMILGKDIECFFIEDPNGVGIQIIKEA